MYAIRSYYETVKGIDKYILDHIDAEDAVLTELDRETNLKVLGARMISGHSYNFV